MENAKDIFTPGELADVMEMIKDPFLFPAVEKKKIINQRPQKKVRTKRNRKKK